MRRIAIVLVIVALGGAGCGKKEKTQTGSASGTGTGEARAPVALAGKLNNHGTKDLSASKDAQAELEVDDFYFAPTFIKASPGGKATLEVTNEGKAAHTFTVDQLGIDQKVDPGTSARVEVSLPSSGALAWYCRFHRDAGMQGAFYFNEGDRVGGTGAPTTTAAARGY